MPFLLRLPFFVKNLAVNGLIQSLGEVPAVPISKIFKCTMNFLAVRRGDVLAAWSGIRPLVIDPNSKSTASIARNHLILVSKSGLVTIAGGKWTTYRSMAIDTMDAAIKACGLKPARECQTDGLLLEGGEGYSPNDFIRLVQDFGLEVEVG